MLSTIEPVLKAHLSSLKNEKDGGTPPIEKSFVRKGDSLARPAKLAPRKSLLSGHGSTDSVSYTHLTLPTILRV